MVLQEKAQKEGRSSEDCDYPMHIPFSLASSHAPGAGTKAILWGNPAQTPPVSVQEQGSQLGSQPQGAGDAGQQIHSFQETRQRDLMILI